MSPKRIEGLHGPSAPTVESIDAGGLAQWDKLVAYCTSLELSVDEVLRNALAPVPLTVDERNLLQGFRAATAEGREGLLKIARSLVPSAAKKS